MAQATALNIMIQPVQMISDTSNVETLCRLTAGRRHVVWCNGICRGRVLKEHKQGVAVAVAGGAVLAAAGKNSAYDE